MACSSAPPVCVLLFLFFFCPSDKPFFQISPLKHALLLYARIVPVTFACDSTQSPFYVGQCPVQGDDLWDFIGYSRMLWPSVLVLLAWVLGLWLVFVASMYRFSLPPFRNAVSADSSGNAKVQRMTRALRKYTQTKLADTVPQVELRFASLCCTVGNKVLLREISGTVQSGKLIAVMGSSGSGKSTLLRCLSGYPILGANQSVEVALNGLGLVSTLLHARLATFNSGVPCWSHTDTVREYLLQEAALHQSKRSKQQQIQNVDALLRLLNLDHVAHARISSWLSQGEKRCRLLPLLLLTDSYAHHP